MQSQASRSAQDAICLSEILIENERIFPLLKPNKYYSVHYNYVVIKNVKHSL